LHRLIKNHIANFITIRLNVHTIKQAKVLIIYIIPGYNYESLGVKITIKTETKNNNMEPNLN